MAKKEKPETEYAIRCFTDKKRRYTSNLSKKEAANFRKAALHLANFLKSVYGV